MDGEGCGVLEGVRENEKGGCGRRNERGRGQCARDAESAVSTAEEREGEKVSE